MAIGYVTIPDLSIFDLANPRPDPHGGKYYVETTFSDRRVHVYPANYGMREWGEGSDFRAYDRWFDYLLGRTWERRMAAAQQKWQRWCDEKNAQEEREDYLNERYSA